MLLRVSQSSTIVTYAIDTGSATDVRTYIIVSVLYEESYPLAGDTLPIGSIDELVLALGNICEELLVCKGPAGI